MINSTAAYKPNVISQVSHELNIPLTGILGMAHFLEQTPLTSQQKEYLQVILTSANRLLGFEGKLIAILKKNQCNA